MKILIPLFFFLFSFILNAQNDIIFEIKHKLGNKDFVLKDEGYNNLGNKFNIQRLHYYISEISIIHDGGKVTNVDDYWILVNTSAPTKEKLGNYDINNIEGVSFYIGVDPEHNHLDPAEYGISHPLGPKSPSMHWGWTAGYRFAAIDGMAGDMLNIEYQLHALGDQNYFKVDLKAGSVKSEGSIIVAVNADYTKTIEDIDISNGLVIHGEEGPAVDFLLNFKDHVFTAVTSPTTDLTESQSLGFFSAYPNPTETGMVTVEIDGLTTVNSSILKISDIFGRVIQSIVIKSSSEKFYNLNIESSGVYFISLFNGKESVSVKKLVVN